MVEIDFTNTEKAMASWGDSAFLVREGITITFPKLNEVYPKNDCMVSSRASSVPEYDYILIQSGSSDHVETLEVNLQIDIESIQNKLADDWPTYEYDFYQPEISIENGVIVIRFKERCECDNYPYCDGPHDQYEVWEYYYAVAITSLSPLKAESRKGYEDLPWSSSHRWHRP